MPSLVCTKNRDHLGQIWRLLWWEAQGKKYPLSHPWVAAASLLFQCTLSILANVKYSAPGLVTCGLALMLVVALFSKLVACISLKDTESSWFGNLSTDLSKENSQRSGVNVGTKKWTYCAKMQQREDCMQGNSLVRNPWGGWKGSIPEMGQERSRISTWWKSWLGKWSLILLPFQWSQKWKQPYRLCRREAARQFRML